MVCLRLFLVGVPDYGELHAASHIGNRTRCSTIFSASGIISLTQRGLLSLMTGRDGTSIGRNWLTGSICYDLFPTGAASQNE